MQSDMLASRQCCHLPRLRWCVAVVVCVAVLLLWRRAFISRPSVALSLRNSSHTAKIPAHSPVVFTSLLNLRSFSYLLKSDVCDSGDTNIVVLIHSHPGHKDLRDTARNHMSKELLRGVGIVRVYLLGRAIDNQKNYPAVPQEVVKLESEKYGDIVQGNFIEHYHNLTYKHVMGLTWVTEFCNQAKYVVKMDDDIAVDLFEVRRLLISKYHDLRNTLLGLVQIDSHPLRVESKWRVSKDEFKAGTYPPFLSGWCYVAPLDAVQKIVQNANTLPYFWIDDVFITGILAEKLGIVREGINHKYTINTYQLRCCSSPDYSPFTYSCDFLAGPTEGDNALLAKTLDQFRHCYRRGCERRGGKELLTRSCIKTQEDSYIGKGVGEVIPLS